MPSQRVDRRRLVQLAGLSALSLASGHERLFLSGAHAATCHGDMPSLADCEIEAPSTAESVVVPNAIAEWWVSPIATYLEKPYARTVTGAIANDGKILACEFNHETGSVERQEVASAPIDDHNVPALWVEHGHRPLMCWTHHGLDNTLRVKVGSLTAELETLVSADLHNLNLGGTASYAQIHRIPHLSTPREDVFWVFTRRTASGWAIAPIVVTLATGSVRFGTVVPIISSSKQMYISTADAYSGDDQTIRIAWGFNPNQTDHAIRYLELNCRTGVFTSPFDDSFVADVEGMNLPITESDLQPWLPDPSAGSRRLFYVRPGPDTPAVAFADWWLSAPDEATYKIAEMLPGTRVLSPNGGYAEAAYDPDMDHTSGFEITVALKTPDSPRGFGVARRWSGNDGWYVDMNRDGELHIVLRNTTMSGTWTDTISSKAIPFAWGSALGLRLVVNRTSGSYECSYSLNPLTRSPTWIRHGVGAIEEGTLRPTNAPLQVGVGKTQPAGVREVYFAESRVSGGAAVAAVDWRDEWPPSVRTHKDSVGTDWFLKEGAAIRPETTKVHEDLGTSGPGFGFRETSNYIPGMAFENPSTHRAVIGASSDDGIERVDRLVLGDNRHSERTILCQPTTEGRLVRPYPPHNGGYLVAIVTALSDYDEATYTDFSSDLRGVQ